MKFAGINPVAYEEYIEAYDFKLCQRASDGSYYGTSDSNQCRIGTEANSADKEVSRSDVTGGLDLSDRKLNAAEPLLNKLNDEEFARVTNVAVDMIQPVEPKCGMYTEAEGQAIIANSDRMLKMADNPRSVLDKEARPVSDAELEATYAIMSTKAKQHLMPSDVVKRMKGADPDFDKEATSKALLKKWMEQDGKDTYTGRKLKFFETELEHIQPIAVLGQKKADKLENFTWIDRNVNQVKSNRSMQNFIDNTKGYSSAEMKARRAESEGKAAAKGGFRASAAADAAKAANQAEQLIKSYGPSNVKYLTRAMGYSDMTSGRDQVGRARGKNLFGNVQTPGSGKRGERIENTLIRGEGKWSASDKKKAQSLIAQHANRIKNGDNKATSLNALQKELEKLG